MDSELIKHYAYELNLHLPEDIQKEAMEWLIENTPSDQLVLVFPPYGKRCWQNGVKFIEKIGYPENEAAFPRLVELFQDINWPGSEEAVQYFEALEKAVVIPYIEAGAKQAIDKHDDQWLWFLFGVCERLMIEREDFRDCSIFDVMKRIYDEDE